MCGSCGSPNPVGRKFCGDCGARLASACSACGAPLDAGQRFCGECGTPAPGAASSPAPTAARAAAVPVAAVAERRLVSVLFADLVGFTPFSEERDSEEVRETLTHYFEIATDVITRHGGTVEKFIGDAVMAVWGAPVAREDDAERAVRSALELLDAIRGLGPGISARAGVLTGEAAVTLGATNQGMVAGDIVNTAARLQSVAAAGTVLVGEATFRAASAAIAFEELGEQVLKGKVAPVPAWRALRVIAERGGRGRTDALEPPFVGRDDELRMLKDAFHATSREGRARLVSVTGPAGIGKSRLAWEFEKYLDGVVDTVWWHHGRSPASGQGVTFWALGEMVRARCGLAESADEPTTRERVDAMLATYLPDPTEQAWVRPAIHALLGIDAERVAAEELFARWRLLFERLSSTGTVVLVFEDLHWADPATMDFIDHLLDWSKSAPVLVVTLARPELLDQRPDWGAGRRTFVALALDPLPDAAMRHLLAGLVPQLPADAAGRIVARAEGIPLYAVETIRMLVADKRLALEGKVYVPVGDVTDLAVPETLTALIAARLDALDPQDRALVLDAAVLGQSFTREALCAISGFPTEELERRLRTLVRRELFTLEADPRSPERGQYVFVQAMIREVAYNTLAKRDRKERHLTAARFFESLGSDELAGALAGHYLSAYENAPEGGEADALAAQARVALRGAAERAYALASFHQAVHLLEQALRVTTDPVDRAATLERMGTAAGMTGRHGEAIGYLEEALAVARSAASPSVVARITLELGRSNVEAGHMDAAIAMLSDESVAAGADREVAIAIRSQLARAWMMRPNHPKALVIADDVLAEADPAGMWTIFVDTLVTKASAFHMLGRPHEGIALLEAALSLSIEHDQLNARFRALYNLAGALAKIDFARGLARTLEGLELARRLGVPYWEHAFVGNVALQAMQTGDWDLALGELDGVDDDTYEGSDRLLVFIGRIQARSLRGEDVSAELSEVRRIVAEDPNDFFRGALTEMAVDTEWNAGNYVAAARAAEDLVQVRPDYEPTARMTAARAWLWAGRVDAAIEHLRALDDAPLQPVTSQVRIDAVRAVFRLVQDEPAAISDLLDAIETMRRAHLELDAVLVSLDAGRFGDPADPRVSSALDLVTAFADRTGAIVLGDLAASLRARRGDEAARSDLGAVRPRPAAG